MMNRYARQIILPEIGEAGQKRLAEASVLIVGAGGLGSPAALYLAAAGAGNIVIADADEVRINNLNRQILYREKDLGQKKIDAARQNLIEFNSRIKIETVGRVDRQKISELFGRTRYAAVIDGTDNFDTRYLLNEASIEFNVPYIYGAVLGWEGQLAVFDAMRGPCYQCVYREPPVDAKTCIEAGVIGALTGIIGAMQASEAIKLIIGAGETLIGKILIINTLANNYKIIDTVRDPHCPACS